MLFVLLCSNNSSRSTARYAITPQSTCNPMRPPDLILTVIAGERNRGGGGVVRFSCDSKPFKSCVRMCPLGTVDLAVLRILRWIRMERRPRRIFDPWTRRRAGKQAGKRNGNNPVLKAAVPVVQFLALCHASRESRSCRLLVAARLHRTRSSSK